MSRSRKKIPIISNACHKRETLRFWKRKANRKIRSDEEIPSGNHYRRMDDRWLWPDDGKHYWDNERAYRK